MSEKAAISQPEAEKPKKIFAKDLKIASMLEGFNLKRFLMEFAGSFAIVFFGNWAQIFCDLGKSNLVAVALSVGIVVTIFTWIGSNISGAHYNPVTTLSMVFLKKIGWSTAIIYWIFQLLGGMIAGAMIYLQVPPDMFKSLKRLNGLGLPTPDKRFTSESVYTEAVATFFFQFALMSLHLDKRATPDVYAIGIGSMMALGILTIGNISGGGINPARVFGPSVITGDLSADIFIFIGGPAFGSLLAAFLYKEIFIEKKKKKVAQEEEAMDEGSEGSDEDGFDDQLANPILDLFQEYGEDFAHAQKQDSSGEEAESEDGALDEKVTQEVTDIALKERENVIARMLKQKMENEVDERDVYDD